ncbi:MAG: HTH-type transcriptional regulator CysL [Syntrophus sp. PtaB.Bin001]|jgi:DNA-binding transcriptional LysR family regulator|nr:MAG: HTH-type transcriptional regulator CysL [Syntrophus sp. PtaB.Bin001]
MIANKIMAYENFKNITIQQLETLVALVEERSFSRASRKVFLTQPSLTKHIKNMEDILNVRLVNRERAGVTLTAEGKILYDYARKLLHLREEAGERLVRIQNDTAGVIDVQASTIPATYILPRVLGDFSNLHPDIRINVQMADSEESMDAIINQRSEIGIIGKKPLNQKLHSEILWEDRLVLAVPKGHHLAGRDMVSWAELLDEPFVIREKGSATREVFEHYLRNMFNWTLSRLRVVVELGSSEAVKEAVIAGLGISMISIHAVERELRSGLLCEVPVENCRIERSFYLIHRRHFALMRHHQIFLDFIRSHKINSGKPFAE